MCHPFCKDPVYFSLDYDHFGYPYLKLCRNETVTDAHTMNAMSNFLETSYVPATKFLQRSEREERLPCFSFRSMTTATEHGN